MSCAPDLRILGVKRCKKEQNGHMCTNHRQSPPAGFEPMRSDRNSRRIPPPKQPQHAFPLDQLCIEHQHEFTIYQTFAQTRRRDDCIITGILKNGAKGKHPPKGFKPSEVSLSLSESATTTVLKGTLRIVQFSAFLVQEI